MYLFGCFRNLYVIIYYSNDYKIINHIHKEDNNMTSKEFDFINNMERDIDLIKRETNHLHEELSNTKKILQKMDNTLTAILKELRDGGK